MKRFGISLCVLALLVVFASSASGAPLAFKDPYYAGPADCATLNGPDPTGVKGNWTWGAPWIAGNFPPGPVPAGQCIQIGLENYEMPWLKEITLKIVYAGGDLGFDLVVWGSEGEAAKSSSSYLLVVVDEPGLLVVRFFVEQPDWEYMRIKNNGGAAANITSLEFDSECNPIPSLTQWGMIGLVVLMLAAGAVIIARKRRVVPNV